MERPAGQDREHRWSYASVVANRRDCTSVERVIASSPGQIFDVIVDPARHFDLDESGTVKAVAATS